MDFWIGTQFSACRYYVIRQILSDIQVVGILAISKIPWPFEIRFALNWWNLFSLNEFKGLEKGLIDGHGDIQQCLLRLCAVTLGCGGRAAGCDLYSHSLQYLNPPYQKPTRKYQQAQSQALKY